MEPDGRQVGRALKRPKHAPSEVEQRPDILLKSGISEAIIYVHRAYVDWAYVDWAQTGVDAGFHGSGCTCLWGQLHGVLPGEQSHGSHDSASEPADRSWYTADSTGLGNFCEQHRDESDYQRCRVDQQRSLGADDQPE